MKQESLPKDPEIKTTVYSSNSSSVEINTTSMTTVLVINVASIPKGKYLAMTNLTYSLQSKIAYPQITYNSGAGVLLNNPPGTAAIYGVINITDTMNTIEFRLQGNTAFTISSYTARLELIQI